MGAKFSDRVVGQKMSYIASLNQQAATLGAQGIKVIKLSGGDPSHVPDEMLNILHDIKNEPKESIFSYSPIAGFDGLRGILAKIASVRYEHHYEKENILICSGGCSGLFLSLKTLLNPGDKVLIQEPCWEYLPRLIENCGGEVVRMQYFTDAYRTDDWPLLIKEVQGHLESGVKVISINSPLNPSGKIIPAQVTSILIKLAKKYGVWFLSDDVTTDFNYVEDGNRMIGNPSNFISVNSFSKNLGITGLRCGYVAGPEEFINHLKKSQLYTFMYPNSLIQKVMERYLHDGGEAYFEFIRKVTTEYAKNAENYEKLLSSIPELEVKKPDGGLFIFPKVRQGYSLDFEKFLKEYHVAIAPGIAFSPSCESNFRVFLGAEEKSVIQAVDLLEAYFVAERVRK